ncbi:MAG: His/Gly/Thr/Pro-type tRNA ligase C-terminal domain-containing protein [Patescibacteria group bacterium]|nr:His/Gly/Thr/Pro-type tRNA ligase C-terminal domain-containing protein [Patescibacteria group bacterium]
MIRLKDTHHSNTSAFLNTAIRVAEYYGFEHLDSARRLGRKELREIRPATISKIEPEIAFARRDEKSLMTAARRCIMCARDKGALLVWRTTGGTASIPSVSFELHVVGTGSVIAEALLIVAAGAIAEESGIKDRILSINNIGSPESNGRYVRDVGSFLRKHIESISPTLRARAGSDPLGTLVQLIERGHPAAPRAPQATEYLTEEERRRFWELLEYLEVFGIPYELNPHILGSKDCWAHSLFEIISVDAESGARIPLACGGRYDPLVSRIVRAPATGATISITCEAKGSLRTGRRRRPVGGVQPAIYFAHLGTEARRRSLTLLEMLRQADIAVHQSLWHDQIGEQMAIARTMSVPYILIMGHKEAVENTVLVREVATNSQEAIPLGELTAYLRRRRIGVGSHETRV